MSGASRAFVYSFAGALLCNFSLHLAESPRRALDFDSKYNVGRWLEDDQRDGRNGCTKLLPRLSSYSPRCSPMCWIRHWRRTWGNLTKYNVGRWLENDLEEGPDGMHKEKAPDIV